MTVVQALIYNEYALEDFWEEVQLTGRWMLSTIDGKNHDLFIEVEFESVTLKLFQFLPKWKRQWIHEDNIRTVNTYIHNCKETS